MRIVSYKKWFFYTGITSVAACLVYLTLVYFLYKAQSYEILWIHNCLTKKESMARSIKGPKIVFAGGSATHFGIRTKDVQEKLGIPCVNMGLHAAIKLDYLLGRLKQVLKPGDVVILPLENEYFRDDGAPNDRTVDYILSYDKAFFRSLPLWDTLRYLANVSPVKFGLDLVTSVLFGETSEEPGKGYNSATLNENGDETGNVGNDRMAKAVMSPDEIQTGKFIETAGLKILKEFNLWGLRNNIAVYLSYANSLYFPQYQNETYRTYYTELAGYFSEHAIATIGTPDDFFYSKEFFYDTIHHLNQEGVTLRTRQFIEIMIAAGIPGNMKNSLN
jgi:hypothetical protein